MQLQQIFRLIHPTSREQKAPMYSWRKMHDKERQEVLAERVRRGGTWRRPPVWESEGLNSFLVTAACYEHRPFIGYSTGRMDAFEQGLLRVLDESSAEIVNYALLPNHYHVLLGVEDIASVRRCLGQLHGRTALTWNREENTPGRKVFHGSAETRIKSDRHFHATVNYVLHNPVKHGHAERWQDWKWSNAAEYLETVGPDEAARRWKEFPVASYGAEWDR